MFGSLSCLGLKDGMTLKTLEQLAWSLDIL